MKRCIIVIAILGAITHPIVAQNIAFVNQSKILSSVKEKRIKESDSEFTFRSVSKKNSIHWNSYIMKSIHGKVPGLVISSTSYGGGSSTKILIRGYTSISGSNQPLFIVDGSPINNSSFGMNGIDFGIGSNDINPEDIKSITVLKGTSATALYGSRGASGVILITTKNGKGNAKLHVEVTSSVFLSKMLRVPQMQNKFGQGWYGKMALDENGSWGPAFDGKDRNWGFITNYSQQRKPYLALPTNVKDFFENGTGYSNSISVSANIKKINLFASYSNLHEDGIIPTSNDNNNRNTFLLHTDAKFKKLKASFAFNFVNRGSSTFPDELGSNSNTDYPTLYSQILQIPRDISLIDLKDENNIFNNLDNYFTVYAQNPYWVLNNTNYVFREDRFYGNTSLTYEITDWLNVNWIIGADAIKNTIRINEDRITYAADGHSNFQGKRSIQGFESQINSTVKEYNSNLLIKFSKNIADFSIGGILGCNAFLSETERASTSTNDVFKFGEYPPIVDGVPVNSTYQTKSGIAGIYGQADFSYKSFVNLSFTARNDWSTTLPQQSNSNFYPGVNLSFVVTEAFPVLAEYITFGKLRFGWGVAGKEANPYLIYQTLANSSISSNFFDINQVNSKEINDIIGSFNLRPERTSEFEYGYEMRLFNNRAVFDITYYKKTTTNLIQQLPVPASSGFNYKWENIGKVENKGIELSINLRPILTSNFSWDFGLTFSNNKNKLIELSKELDKITFISMPNGVEFVALPGYPLGVFMGPKATTDKNGNIVVNDRSGYPIIENTKEVWGNAENKFVLGINNVFNFKNFKLNILFDIRKGGLIYSGSSDLNIFVGNSTQTLYNNRQPFIIPNSVKLNSWNKYVENDIPIDMSAMNGYYYNTYNALSSKMRLYNRSFVKLRELVLSYSLPKSLLLNLPISSIEISFIGRNLLMWTPKDNNFIDPEVSSWGNDLIGDFGENRMPPTARTFAVSLKLKF